ncbi:MAG: T9SS type A sorting domain-containing protein [bacterium]
MKYLIKLIFGIFLFLNFQNTNGQWIPANGPNMGTVTSIVLNSNTIFVGTKDGGIYFSNNEGESWEAANIGYPTADVYDLNLHENILYAATSKGIYKSNLSDNNWSFVNDTIIFKHLVILGEKMFAGRKGKGIYLSTNNGKTWEEKNLGISNKTITSLAIDGNNIYAGTETTLYLSKNFGESWIAIFNSPWGRFFSTEVVNEKIYAGINGGLYCSFDQGMTWEIANSSLPTSPVYAILSVGEEIYIGFDADGVYYSPDNGNTWSELNETLFDNPYEEKSVLTLATKENKIYAGTKSKGIFSYSKTTKKWQDLNSGLFSLAINRYMLSNNNYIQQQGIDAYNNNVYVNGEYGVYISADNGINWKYKEFNNGSIEGWTYPRCLKVQDNSIFVGVATAIQNQGGVYKSIDNGNNWSFFNKGIENEDVNSFTIKNENIFAATYNGIFKSGVDNANWSAINYGLNVKEIKHIVSTDKYLYAGSIYKSQGGIYRSSDNGESWVNILPVSGVLELNVNGDLLMAVVAKRDSHSSSDYASFIKSTDNGITWTEINTWTEITKYFYYYVSAIEVKKSHLLIGTTYGYENGKIFYSQNEGINWEDISQGVSNEKSIEIVDFAINGNDVYALSTSGVYYRNDLKTPVKEITNYSKLKIRPNPVSEFVTFRWPESENQLYLEIFNDIGQKIFDELIFNNVPVDVKSLNGGFYIYRLSDKKSNSVQSGKLIIK